jgi:chaperonin GroES
MRVTPLHDRVLVRRLEEGDQTVGRIIIPDTAKEKPQQGQVIAVGKGRVNDDGKRVPLELEVGDRILFAKYAQEITLAGEAYLILRQEEVLAVLTGGGETTASRTVKQIPRTTTRKTTPKRKPKPAAKTKKLGNRSRRKKAKKK